MRGRLGSGIRYKWGQRAGVDSDGKGAGGGAGGSGRALRVVAVALGETVVVEVLWWRW